MLSASKIKANRAWDSRNMVNLSCRVRREFADQTGADLAAVFNFGIVNAGDFQDVVPTIFLLGTNQADVFFRIFRTWTGHNRTSNREPLK